MGVFVISTAMLLAFLRYQSLAPTRSGAAGNCTIYVSSTQALIEASTDSTPGAVICLRDGTYLLTRPLYISPSGTADKWIVYKAQNPGRAIIKWNSNIPDDMFQLTKGNPGTSYVEISDLVFDGSYNGVNTAKNAVHGHVGTHHLKVINNHMKNLKGSGIGMGESDYTWVIGNRIHHVGNYSSDGEDGWGSGITFNAARWHDRYSGIHSYVIGNIISGVVDGSDHNTDGNGIIMDKSKSFNEGTPPVLISNNVIFQSGGRCIHHLEVSNIWTVNNTCYSNNLDSRIGSVGEYTYQRARNSYLVNNVAHAWTKGYTFMESTDSDNIKYYNNLGFGGRGSTGVQSPPRVANPLFVNAPSLHSSNDRQYAQAVDVLNITNNFHLQANSPAINAGVDPTTLTSDANLKRDLAAYVYKDYSGVARPQDRGFDIGAYELVKATTSGTPAGAPRPPTTSPPQGILGTSQITIYAGSTPVNGTYATMELYVNNVKVKTFTNVKADEQNLKFLPYTYSSPTKLSRSQIKIRFTNDGVNSDRSQDRNLYVDKIVIDGVSYETEASSTYSTGVYSSGVGCVAGYKKSQILSCNGYFQY